MTSPATDDKKKQIFCDQLRVLTGEYSDSLLQTAYSNCNGDISNAIKYINTCRTEFPQNAEMPDYSGRSLNHQKSATISALVPIQADVGDTMTRVDLAQQNYALKSNVQLTPNNLVIDRTEDDTELQRAIKLSMECSVAQSPSETRTADDAKSGDGSSRESTMSSDAAAKRHSHNPHLRRRISADWPAGLKNLSNTCWFSAVIQSLFNLPVFRNHVLQYKSPSELPPPDSESYRNICFMQELKSLFALLIGSRQSYVDPTKCVNQMKTAFIRAEENHQQQDVSEFTHKLLDWLEEALAHKQVSSSTSAEKNQQTSPMDVDSVDESREHREVQSNPMVGLFYGEYKAQGVNNGNSFTTPQKFGIFPLYVNGIDNLHDGLEYTTQDRPHLQHSSETKAGVGQEHWFTKLPPILIFELSRFHYNPTSEAPEKIHSRFDFPHLLYMDRYMEWNAEKTRQCREHYDKLVSQLHIVKDELRKKRKVTMGAKSFCIQDVLKCCTEFAASKRKRYMEDKRSGDSTKRIRNSFSENIPQGSGAGDSLSEDVGGAETKKKIENASVVEACLKTWLDELEEEKEGLRDDINDIQKRLDTMYDDPLLKQHPYDLHAVLIHQGFAAAGHYWAYVKDHKKSRWLKFNDTEVRETDLDELVVDSIGGGQGVTSAYCLMYIDRTKKEMLMGGEQADTIVFSDKELREIVDKHNMDYSNEMEEWDIKQAKIRSLAPEQNVEPEDSSTTAGKGRKESEGSDVVFSKSSAKSSTNEKRRNEASASWNPQASLKAIQQAHKLYETLGPEETLEYVLKVEWDRLRKLESQVSINSDVRLQHVVVYMFRNQAPRKIIERTLLEQFADDRMTYDHRATEIMNCAKDKLKTISSKDLNEEDYQRWHRNYRFFCQATCYLLQGLELWNRGRFGEALPYLANIKHENEKLSTTMSGESSPELFANWDLGLKAISKCLESMHEKAFKQVQKDDDKEMSDGITLLVDFVIPWIHLLPTESSGIETPLVERIRNDWCSLDVQEGNNNCARVFLSCQSRWIISHKLIVEEEKMREKHECAVQALMDPPTTLHSPAISRPDNAQDLCERFQKVMSMITH